MVCQRGGFIIQRHNELRDLKAGMLRIVCNDVEVEPVLQEVTGETLNHGANKAPDARLDIHSRGFWERQRSAFLDVRVYHPNADSYRELTPKQSFKKHENEAVCGKSNGDRTGNVHSSNFHDHRRNGG